MYNPLSLYHNPVLIENIFRDTANIDSNISEIVKAGFDGLSINIYYDSSSGELMICNSIDDNFGISTGVELAVGLSTINTWLQQHPDKSLIVNIDGHLIAEQQEQLNLIVSEVFGRQHIISQSDIAQFRDNGVANTDPDPTERKRVLIMSKSDIAAEFVVSPEHLHDIYGNAVKSTYIREEDLKTLFTTNNAPDNIPNNTSIGAKITNALNPLLQASGLDIEIDNIRANLKSFWKTISLDIAPLGLFIPSAITAGTILSDVTQNAPQIQMASALTLSYIMPPAGQIVFYSTIEGRNAYTNYMNELKGDNTLSTQQYLDAIAAVIPPAFNIGLDTAELLAKDQVNAFLGQQSTTVPNPLSNLGSASFIWNAAADWVSNHVIAQPMLGVIKGVRNTINPTQPKILLERVEEGFIKGVEASFFGLVDFSSLYQSEESVSQNIDVEIKPKHTTHAEKVTSSRSEPNSIQL